MTKAKIVAIVFFSAAVAGAVTAGAARAALPSQTASTKLQDRIVPSAGFAARAATPADFQLAGPRDRLDRARSAPLSTAR